MKLVRYNPFQELQILEQDLDKLWGEGWGLAPSITESTSMDLYQEGNNVVAEVSLPNFKKEDIKITTDGGMLEISAEHQEKEEDKDKRHYYFRESSNRYLRRVALPDGTKTDTIEAAFKDGVLKVSMQASTPKKLETKAVPIK